MVGEARPQCNDHLSNEQDGFHNWVTYDGGGSHAGTIVPINYDSCAGTICDAGRQGQPDPTVDATNSFNNWNIAWGFKSSHVAGVNFLMADGSVQFLMQDVNHQAYQKLGCRDDGKQLGPLQY